MVSQQHSQVGKPLRFSEKETEAPREVVTSQERAFSKHRRPRSRGKVEVIRLQRSPARSSQPSTIHSGPRTKPGAEHTVRDMIFGRRQLWHGILALTVVTLLLFSRGSLMPSTGLDTGDTARRRDMAPVLEKGKVGKERGKYADI